MQTIDVLKRDTSAAAVFTVDDDPARDTLHALDKLREKYRKANARIAEAQRRLDGYRAGFARAEETAVHSRDRINQQAQAQIAAADANLERERQQMLAVEADLVKVTLEVEAAVAEIIREAEALPNFDRVRKLFERLENFRAEILGGEEAAR